MTPYLQFNRHQWAALRDSVPMTLTEEEITRLKGINEDLSLEEVAEIYLPLSRLLNFYISSNLRRQAVLEQFLGTNGQRIPYIISIAGSVAVGKSTTARVLQALLSRWPEHRHVELITTDGFLHPNSVLKERGLMKKKGFPQSYDMHRLVIGIVIAEVLQQLGAEQVRVKWPNDIYLQDRKLSGILVELTGNTGDAAQIVSGAGINLVMRRVESDVVNQGWISLQEAGVVIDRNLLAARLIKELRLGLGLFEQEGLAPYLPRWEKLDNFIHRPVKLIIGDKEIYGISRGIDAPVT